MGKIYVTQPSIPELDEYVEELKDIWDSKWLTNMGEKHNLLEQKLCEFLHTSYCKVFANGHLALELLLQSLQLKGEVITTPFTFVSTTHAIVRNGLTPVFCDINPEDYTIDVTKIEELITKDTSAIVPVHVYGNICNVEEIERIANKYNLKVVYDAAHAFGTSYKGKSVAEFGDASMFSFHSTKVFNTIEGGAVCTRNSELDKMLFELRDFGIQDEETVNYVGGNAKMNEFQAAMGLCNLRHLKEQIEKRKKIVELYRNRLGNVDGIRICTPSKYVTSNYAYFPIVIDEKIFGCDRNEVKKRLEESGIYARKYFYPLTCDFDCYKGMFDNSTLPIARWIAERVLTLPLYANLPIDIANKVADLIAECKTGAM